MPYTHLEKSKLQSFKPNHYYTEDHNYHVSHKKSSENACIPDHDLTNTKRKSHKLPAVNYINERKCPIYVHRFSKISQDLSHPPKLLTQNEMKMKTSKESKLVLDKLEETYWATWKPKKERAPGVPGKPRRKTKKQNKSENLARNTAYGDVNDTFSESLVEYFGINNFDTSTAVDEGDLEKPVKTKNFDTSTAVSDFEKPVKEVRKKEEEIQTDACAVVKNKVDKNQKETKVSSSERLVVSEEIRLESDGNEDKKENLEENLEEEIKVLKHTDSFIITKKKREEIETKETFQQPKYIRLYKKSGASSSSYIKGGSYPLKSCLRKDSSTAKGSFRLGAPGSPLFITSSSIRKKK